MSGLSHLDGHRTRRLDDIDGRQTLFLVVILFHVSGHHPITRVVKGPAPQIRACLEVRDIVERAFLHAFASLGTVVSRPHLLARFPDGKVPTTFAECKSSLSNGV